MQQAGRDLLEDDLAAAVNTFVDLNPAQKMYMVGNAGLHQDAHFVKQIDFSKTTENVCIDMDL